MNDKNPINLGPREFILPISKAKVEFDSGSLIQFFDKDDCMLLQIDPTELSVIYGSYLQMMREEEGQA